jgi:beta-lactamase class A
MRNPCLVALLVGAAATPARAQDPGFLRAALEARIRQDTAVVGLSFLDPARGDSLDIQGGLRFHAASTMKVPVLIELGRRVDAGELKWDDSLLVHNEFRSLVDGSPYVLDLKDDSDSSMYTHEGQRLPIRELASIMITRSSNLATNLLITRLDPKRVDATAHKLGADSIHVLRGVEDGKAYALGMNNTTTARDLAVLLRALAKGTAASPASTRVMLDMLLGQEFNDGIPAGLPPGVKVAHKTGEITALLHDAAIIYPPGREPYVLVILTRGLPEHDSLAKLQADLSRVVYDWATRPAS